MRGLLNVVWALLLLVLGFALLFWGGYNVFVELQPGMEWWKLISLTVFGVVLVGTGIQRLRKKPR